jgi:hypothetical protein
LTCGFEKSYGITAFFPIHCQEAKSAPRDHVSALCGDEVEKCRNAVMAQGNMIIQKNLR